MKRVIIVLVLVLFLASCTIQTAEVECVKDADCSKAGCSSQLCTTKEKAIKTITTCEWKDEYECYKKVECGCVNNKCNWKDQNKLDKCLEEFR